MYSSMARISNDTWLSDVCARARWRDVVIDPGPQEAHLVFEPVRELKPSSDS